MWQFMLSAGRAGLRSRSIQAILILGALLVGIAYLSASFSPRQPQTVALDVGLSGLRITLVLFSLFWVQELVAREIERRTVLFSLTYPVPRGRYIVGRYLGVLGAACPGGFVARAVALGGGAESGQRLRAGFCVVLGLPYWSTVAGLWVDAALVQLLRCGSRPFPRCRCCPWRWAWRLRWGKEPGRGGRLSGQGRRW
jgi:Cu-processing system permease protein